MELDYLKVSLILKRRIFILDCKLGSPYRERFSEIVLHLQEKGIVSKLRYKKRKEIYLF
jgi:hypothetical protein